MGPRASKKQELPGARHPPLSSTPLLPAMADATRAALSFLEWTPIPKVVPPEPEVEAELIRLFACPGGKCRYLQFIVDLDAWPSQGEAFLAWVFTFITDRLPPAVWANHEAVHFLLSSDLGGHGLDVIGLLKSAGKRMPSLRTDLFLLDVALRRDLRALDCFDPDFLAGNPLGRDLVTSACRGTYARHIAENPGDGFWGVPWRPVDQAPGGFLAALPPCFANREFLLEAACFVDDGGVSFAGLPLGLRADRDVAMAFVSRQKGILRSVPPALLEDEELVRTAVALDPDSFPHAPRRFWEDTGLAQIAVASGGRAFFASEVGLLHVGRKDTMLEAVAVHFDSILYASVELQGDADVVEALLTGPHVRSILAFPRPATHDKTDLIYVWKEVVPPALRYDHSFLRRVLSQHGLVLGLLERHQRADPVLVAEAVRQDGAALGEADPSVWSRLPRRRRVAIEPYPAKREEADALYFARSLLAVNRGCWSQIPVDLRQRLGFAVHECCVCQELPSDVVRQCLEGGHRVCGDCASQIIVLASVEMKEAECPVCRAEVGNHQIGKAPYCAYGARNRFAEDTLTALIGPAGGSSAQAPARR